MTRPGHSQVLPNMSPGLLRPSLWRLHVTFLTKHQKPGNGGRAQGRNTRHQNREVWQRGQSHPRQPGGWAVGAQWGQAGVLDARSAEQLGPGWSLVRAWCRGMGSAVALVASGLPLGPGAWRVGGLQATGVCLWGPPPPCVLATG